MRVQKYYSYFAAVISILTFLLLQLYPSDPLDHVMSHDPTVESDEELLGLEPTAPVRPKCVCVCLFVCLFVCLCV